jgi:DNA-binding NtrC family response regulator
MARGASPTQTQSVPTLLVVDDEQTLRFTIAEWARITGFHPVTVATGAEALAALADRGADAVLLDLKLGDEDGLEVFKRLRAEDPHLPIVMLTGHGTIEHAVHATRMGVFDFVIKPPNLTHLEVVLRRALDHARLQREVEHLRGASRPTTMIGESAAFKRTLDRLHKAAKRSNTPILILGETGTGKELMARYVHEESPLAAGPFIAINCSAISELLLESELFGHEKGAFTDARHAKKGLFEVADTGTLFLDEIGEMSFKLQAKLLRVLEDGTFRRVGGNTDITVSVRVVAATHRDLKRSIADGAFREDLYYRLNGVSVVMPALRERPDDIPFLADHFLAHFAHRSGRVPPRLMPDAIAALQGYPWPGNVRELRNAMDSVLVFEEGDEIRAEHLPADVVARAGVTPAVSDRQPFPAGVVRPLHEIERMAIDHALRECAGNKTRAAEKLQISRQTLRTKLKDYGLMDDSEGSAEAES